MAMKDKILLHQARREQYSIENFIGNTTKGLNFFSSRTSFSLMAKKVPTSLSFMNPVILLNNNHLLNTAG